MTPVLLAVMVGTAGACPKGEGSDECTAAHADAATPKADPAHCARRMIGPEACSWTTSMMAQRVLEEGTPWTFVGRLAAADAPLPSKVAAPFTIGPDERIHVVANEVLDQLGDPVSRGRVHLTGRLLEVDGVQYFVATTLTPASS